MRQFWLADFFRPTPHYRQVELVDIFLYWKQKWTKENLDVHPPRNLKAITQSFRALNFDAPEQLVSLYSVLDGKEEMDKEHFRLRRLDEIVEENSSQQEFSRIDEHGILFSDYLINSWCYRIKSNGEVLLDSCEHDRLPTLKSKSLVEFFETMASDPDEALLWRPVVPLARTSRGQVNA